MEAKYEKSRTLLLKLIVVRCDNQDYEHFRQKLRDKLLKVRLQSIEGTFLFYVCEFWPTTVVRTLERDPKQASGGENPTAWKQKTSARAISIEKEVKMQNLRKVLSLEEEFTKSCSTETPKTKKKS